MQTQLTLKKFTNGKLTSTKKVTVSHTSVYDAIQTYVSSQSWSKEFRPNAGWASGNVKLNENQTLFVTR